MKSAIYVYQFHYIARIQHFANKAILSLWMGAPCFAKIEEPAMAWEACRVLASSAGVEGTAVGVLRLTSTRHLFGEHSATNYLLRGPMFRALN